MTSELHIGVIKSDKLVITERLLDDMKRDQGCRKRGGGAGGPWQGAKKGHIF